MLPPLPKLVTVHPVVESLPPLIIHFKKIAHISALFTPLVVRCVLARAIFDWCCLPVAVASTSQKNSKKATTMMTINKYCPNASLTRTLTHHHGLGICINLPTPFATLFCCSATGSWWTILFLGTTRGGGMVRGMATTSWGRQDAAVLVDVSENKS
jgi:hypothetical protein